MIFHLKKENPNLTNYSLFTPTVLSKTENSQTISLF